MSIIRAPRPDRGFTILDNDVLRDRRLSFKARGVLAWILSQPDNWRTDADKLSKEGLEGRDAIRSALRELRAAGYIVQTRRQDDRGRWVTVTMVYDRPQDVSAGHTEDGKPAVGDPDVGDTAANRSTTKNDYEEDEKSCVDAPRRPGDEDQPKSNWREEDRRLFVEIVGSDWIRVVEGGPWGPGKFKTTALYEAMRKGAGRVEPKKWPGIYLRGLEDWEDYLGGLSVEVA